MKNMKKIFYVLLASFVICALSTTAFAAHTMRIVTNDGRNETEVNVGGTFTVFVEVVLASPEELDAISSVISFNPAGLSIDNSADATRDSIPFVGTGPNLLTTRLPIREPVPGLIGGAIATVEGNIILPAGTYRTLINLEFEALNLGTYVLTLPVNPANPGYARASSLTKTVGDTKVFIPTPVTKESFTVNVVNAPQLHAISASPAELPFGSLQATYTQPPAQIVTVRNIGTESVTLTQPTATNYEIGALSATNLAAGAEATFTIRPRASLPPGNYNETITITGSNNTNAAVTVSFTVTPSTISASPTALSFGSLLPPYTQPPAQMVTITNPGTGSVILTQPTATNLDIGALSATSLAAGAMATFTVRPNAGLPHGNYNETITVTGSNGALATVTARFAVIDPNNNATIGGTSIDLGTNASGEGWNWNAAARTLSLTGGGFDLEDVAIVTNNPITINTTGNATAKSIVNTGTGNLTITGGQGTSLTLNTTDGPAIRANGAIEINSGAVHASTAAANVSAIISNGSVTISGNAVVSATAANASAIAANSVIIGGNANVTAETLAGNGSAINAAANINISTSGNVKAIAVSGYSLEASAISITNGTTELTFNAGAIPPGRAFNVNPTFSVPASVFANGIQIFPIVPPQITAHPQNQTVSPGSTATFRVTATGATPLTFQWQRLNVGGTWSDIAGAILAAYSLTAQMADDDAQFRVVVSNNFGSVTSNAATLTVRVVVPSTAPQVTEHPNNQMVNPGNTVTFSAAATGTVPLTYQWFRIPFGSFTSFPVTAQTTDPAYSFTAQAADNGAQFFVVVRNNYGEAMSNAATLTVTTFIPVAFITGVPTTATARAPLILTGMAVPSDATNRTIEWSVLNAGETGAAITGNVFNATAAGTAVVTATIANGQAVGTSYTENFTITVNAGDGGGGGGGCNAGFIGMALVLVVSFLFSRREIGRQ